MGKLADEAIQARQQRRTNDLMKVAATHASAGTPSASGGRGRRAAIAKVRRAVRTQRLAREAIVCADDQAATSMRFLVDQGIAQGDIAAFCGVPLWTVRRLLTLSQPSTPAAVRGNDVE